MAKINLLPWREEERAEKTKQFGLAALLTGIVGAVAVYAGLQFGNNKVEHQQARNTYLQNEIDNLKKDLKEIEELESTKTRLLARMDIIQELQARRPQVVHTFQELAERVPDGVFMMSMKQDRDVLAFEGKADSNARVSTLMRNLGASDWFKQPGLELINSQNSKNGISSFKLRLSQSVAKAEEQ